MLNWSLDASQRVPKRWSAGIVAGGERGASQVVEGQPLAQWGAAGLLLLGLVQERLTEEELRVGRQLTMIEAVKGFSAPSGLAPHCLSRFDTRDPWEK